MRTAIAPLTVELEKAVLHEHDLHEGPYIHHVMAGVDLRTVQELAGHKNIAMTCRYALLAPGHQQTAVEKLVLPSATGDLGCREEIGIVQ